MPTDLETYPDHGAVRFVKRRDFGDVVNATVRFVRDNLRALALGQLTIAGPALVLFVALQVLTGATALFDITKSFSTEPQEVMASLGAAVLMVYFGFAVYYLLVYAVAFGAVRAYRRDGEVHARELWDDTRPALLPMVSVTVVAYGTLVAIALLVGVVGAVTFAPVAVLGLLVLMVAFLFAFPAWIAAYPVRVFEAPSAIAALRRGWELTRGRWWFVVGTLFVVGLVGLVASTLFAIPGALINVALTSAGLGESVVGPAVGSAFQLLGAMASTTLSAVALSFIHGSLVADTDEVSLHDGLDRLAAGEASIAELMDDPSNPLRDGAATRSDVPAVRADDDALRPPAPEPPTDAPPDGAPADDPNAAGRGGFRGGGFGS